MDYHNHQTEELKQSTSTENTLADRKNNNTNHQRKHRHSRIHSKNLSIYFPRPDQRSYHSSLHSPNTAQVLDIPPANIIVWDGQPNLTHSTTPIDRPNAHQPEPISEQPSNTRTRRGHHHRHSLSHNFFPFPGDNTATPPATPVTKVGPNKKSPPNSQSLNSWKFPLPPITPTSAIPKPVPYNQSNSKHSLPRNSINPTRLEKKITHLNMPLKTIISLYFHTNLFTKLKITVGLCTGLLGCFFWLKAQDSHLLSLSGLGYLLVFDALGTWYRVCFEGDAEGIERAWEALGDKDHHANLKRPFGRARVNTLGQFSQALFLVFSGIYIAKEAFEHLLISHPHSSSDHSVSSHSAHSSSPTDLHHQDHKMAIPLSWIILSGLLVLFSALISKNHQSLTSLIKAKEAEPAQGDQQPSPCTENKPNYLFKINPFSALPLVFGGLIALSAWVFSTSQLEKADGYISCLMVYSIFKLAWPLALLTGKVLLQTAPLESESNTLSKLQSAIETIQKGNEAVMKNNLSYIEPVKVWRLSILESDLICNLILHIKQDTTDLEILEITEFVRSSLVGIGTEINVDVVKGDAAKSILRPASTATAGCSHHHHHDHEDHHHHHDHDHQDHDDYHHHDRDVQKEQKHDPHHHHHEHEEKADKEQLDFNIKPKLISQLSSDHSSSSDHSELCCSDDDVRSVGISSTGDNEEHHHHHHQLGHHHSHLHFH